MLQNVFFISWTFLQTKECDESGPLCKEDMYGCTLTCEPFKSHDAEIGPTTVDDKGQEQAKPPDDEILQKYDVSYHLYNIWN